MKRDIKFRSYNKASNDMAYGVVLSGDTTTEEGDEVLMQYTGLKDKNGVEIYEGDVVSWSTSALDSKSSNKRFYTTEVFWNEKEGGWYCERGSVFCMAIYDDIEVKGNIYEQPELLRAGDD